MSVRAVLVDDHGLVREGLRELLESRTLVTVVGEASDGREGVELTARLRPDVVVMDVWLPRLSGIAATAEIHRQTPSAKVIILSVHARADFVEDALCAGALAYVVKTAATQELISAIDAVTHGKKYISPAVAEVLLDRLVHPDEADHGPLATLTPREREILQRVAEGLSAKEIAGDLHISARTVETHRGSIMRKLGVHKTAGLVRLAIREGLLGP